MSIIGRRRGPLSVRKYANKKDSHRSQLLLARLRVRGDQDELHARVGGVAGCFELLLLELIARETGRRLRVF